jgi:mono/diheme cytochrome c family protein
VSRVLLVLGGAALALLGCRGQPSTDPPFRLIQDMMFQPKVLPEAPSHFYEDGSGMRKPPEGTVADEELREDVAWFQGQSADGGFVARIPGGVDEVRLSRGQERFDIYCSPCHDKAGSGQGVVVRRGFYRPVDLASDHTRGLADGEIFDIISHGVRNMPAYRFQIPAADRWAIVSWVRVLERSQHAAIGDVPLETVPKIEPEGSGP